ncbi:MAG TPA: sugar ABC transporter permease [Phototrophicaceae bacterium]|nr:sugar ABC transporter permease [Phototrophicaceae bacterium]
MNDPAAVSAANVIKPKSTRIFPRIRIGRKGVRQNDLAGYLFISPWLFGFFIFTLIPMGMSLWLAFTNYDILGGWEYVGLKNFERMFFQDIRYGRALTATFKYVLVAVPFRLMFALGIAMLLNTKRRGVYWYRAAFYIPSVIGGSVAVAVMWRQLFGVEGVVNGVVESLGLAPVNWLGNPNTAIWTLILLAVWQFGSPMLIFLAGLRQIPQEMYESASIDGANGWQKFVGITLPLLTPIIFFNLVMQTISGFKVFTQAFIVSGGTGAPLDTTLLYSLYLYRRGFSDFEMGYAAAMAWVMLGIIGVLTAISFKLSSLWVYYETDVQ